MWSLLARRGGPRTTPTRGTGSVSPRMKHTKTSIPDSMERWAPNHILCYLILPTTSMQDEYGSSGLDPEVPSSPERSFKSSNAGNLRKTDGHTKATKAVWYVICQVLRILGLELTHSEQVYEDVFDSPDIELTPPGTPMVSSYPRHQTVDTSVTTFTQDFSSQIFGTSWCQNSPFVPPTRIVDCVHGSPHIANLSFNCPEDASSTCFVEDIHEPSHPLRRHVANQLKRFWTQAINDVMKDIGWCDLELTGEDGVMEEGGEGRSPIPRIIWSTPTTDVASSSPLFSLLPRYRTR